MTRTHLEWVDRSALEPKWRLPVWHAIAADGRRSTVGARNLDVLRQRLEPVMLRRRRSEILTQLPPRTDSRLAVQLTDDQREAHDDLAQPIAQLMSIAKRRPLTQKEFLRLMSLLTTQRVIANGLAQLDFNRVWPGIAGVERPDPSLLDGLQSPKLVELRELIERVAVGQERKVVVFSQWRRLGQEQPIDVYHLVAEDCIESRIASLVADKSALFGSLFDGTSDEVHFEGSGSFLEGIAKLVDADQVARPVADPDAAAEQRLEEMVTTADERQDAPAETREVEESVGAAAAPVAASLQSVFRQLEVQPTRDGGLRIDAPPEAAQTLVELFQGMAELLKRAAG